MVEIFTKFVENDCIGKISKLYLGLTDFHPEGLFSEPAMELAKLISQAVDFPKTGVPVNMNNLGKYGKYISI